MHRVVVLLAGRLPLRYCLLLLTCCLLESLEETGSGAGRKFADRRLFAALRKAIFQLRLCRHDAGGWFAGSEEIEEK